MMILCHRQQRLVTTRRPQDAVDSFRQGRDLGMGGPVPPSGKTPARSGLDCPATINSARLSRVYSRNTYSIVSHRIGGLYCCTPRTTQELDFFPRNRSIPSIKACQSFIIGRRRSFYTSFRPAGPRENKSFDGTRIEKSSGSNNQIMLFVGLVVVVVVLEEARTVLSTTSAVNGQTKSCDDRTMGMLGRRRISSLTGTKCGLLIHSHVHNLARLCFLVTLPEALTALVVPLEVSSQCRARRSMVSGAIKLCQGYTSIRPLSKYIVLTRRASLASLTIASLNKQNK
jgi:hypothetical protein